MFETEKRGLRGRRPGGEASVLEVDSDVAVHTDLNLDAGAGVGDPMRMALVKKVVFEVRVMRRPQSGSETWH